MKSNSDLSSRLFQNKMKTISLVIIALLCCLSLTAQVETINLPKGNNQIKVNVFTPIISIYVDPNSEVYLEKRPINVYELGKELSYIRYKLEFHLQERISIHLYIDETVDYFIVDKIKTQLANSYFYSVLYKTNSVEDKDILSGVSWRNHQSFFHIKRPEKILTKSQHEENKRFNDSINREFGNIPPPPPPIYNWFFESQHKIYSDSEDAINEALENKKYICAKLSNDGFIIDSQLIKFNDVKKLKELFYFQEVVFVKFSDELKYSNYLKAILKFKELDPKNSAFFFELSREIVNLHERSKIKLCD